MKKKTFVKGTLFGLCTLLLLTSCAENEGHEHVYATVWSADEEYHWYDASCEHAGERENRARHKDRDRDGGCDVCAYPLCTHRYALTPSADQTHHWYAAVCGCDVPAYAWGAHADADRNGVCDLPACAYLLCAHAWAAEGWESSETHHWRAAACACLLEPAAFAAENGYAPHLDSEDDDGVCDACGFLVGHACVPDCSVWVSDEEGHWNPSLSCGHTTVRHHYAAHLDGDRDGVCDHPACAYLLCAHAWAAEGWESSETHHWHPATCACLLAPAAFAAESGYAAHLDRDRDGTCDDCAYPICTHTYDTSQWVADGSGHWHAPSCAYGCEIPGVDYAAHGDGDGNGLCDACGYQLEHLCTPDLSRYLADGEGHWHPADGCGHPVRFLYTPHSDGDGDGLCDTVGCEYPLATDA